MDPIESTMIIFNEMFPYHKDDLIDFPGEQYCPPDPQEIVDMDLKLIQNHKSNSESDFDDIPF